MKIKLLFAILLLSLSATAYQAQSQRRVGINTDQPATTLDVKATTTDNTIADAILAPRMTATELNDKNAAFSTLQDGALVFVTSGTGTTATKTELITGKGFYYFDANAASNVGRWIPAGATGATTEPWNVESSTSQATTNNQNINQNIYQSGNIGISKGNNYFQSNPIPRAITIVGDGGASDDLMIQSFTGSSSSSSTSSGQLAQYKTRGIIGAVTPVQTNDVLGALSFGGNGTTGNTPGFLDTANISAIVNGTVTATAAPTDLTFNVGSSSSPERVRMTSNGRVGIGTNSPTATVHLVGNSPAAGAISTIRLENLPSSNDPLVSNASRTLIDYTKLAPIYADQNGNLVRGYDPGDNNTTSLTFDGDYTVPVVLTGTALTASNGVKILDVNAYSLLKFDIYTGLVLGQVGTGSNIYSSLAFSTGSGFTANNSISGSGGTTTTYPLIITTNNNANTQQTLATLAATADFYFGGVNASSVRLTFYYVSTSTTTRQIRAVGIKSNASVATSNFSIAVINSKKYR